VDHFDNMAGLREGCGKRQLRHPASSPPRLGPRRQHARFSWRKASDMPSRNRRYCLPRLKNRSTALRTRKGWRANSPHVPSDRGLVGHGGSGRFAVVESACRPERKHGDELGEGFRLFSGRTLHAPRVAGSGCSL
jgi:hypothetical protein